MDPNQILDRVNSLTHPTENYIYRLFVHLLEPYKIFYGIDCDGHLIFVIPSLNPMIPHQIQHTRKLVLNSNLRCQAILSDAPSTMTVHSLTCLSTLYDEKIAFIRLTEAFSKHIFDNKQSIISELFSALVNLFAQEDKSSEKELQGLYAELYLIYYFFKKGINLSPYWQIKDKMKFDFSMSAYKRIEVKSTIRNERIHHFRHEQLLSDLYNITIASLLLRKDDAGLSLFSLIKLVQSIAANNFNLLLYVDRFIKNVPNDELCELRYDEIYTTRNLRFYPASIIPKFSEWQPDGVTHAEYDSDLTTIRSYSETDMMNWLKDVEEDFNV